MNAERARALLDAYGAREANWPEEHREALREFFASSPAHEPLLREAQALDAALDSYAVMGADLSERVMQALPVSVGERLLRWLWPDAGSGLWRPAFAACMPLLLGFAIGFTPIGDTLVTADGESTWEAQEQALLFTGGLGDWYE